MINATMIDDQRCHHLSACLRFLDAAAGRPWIGLVFERRRHRNAERHLRTGLAAARQKLACVGTEIARLQQRIAAMTTCSALEKIAEMDRKIAVRIDAAVLALAIQ